MDDEQLRRIARDMTNTAIDNAMDKILTDKMAGDLDQSVEDIVALTIERSITSLREGKTSPTDNVIKGLNRNLDKEIDEIVELTIGKSVTAIREGKWSPTDKKMKELFVASQEVANVKTGSDLLQINDMKTKPSLTGSGSGHRPEIAISDLVQGNSSTGTMTTRQLSEASGKKNVLGRLFDILFKRYKKEVKEFDVSKAGGSSSFNGVSVGGQTTRSSKSHNTKGWIRRNLLCCFVRQTATVEPFCE